MTTPFELYKRFIDGLVGIIPSVNARWVREHRDWPKTPKNERIINSAAWNTFRRITTINADPNVIAPKMMNRIC